MKLNRKSKFVRFAFWGSDWGVPHETSICELFWRGLVVMPLICLVCVGFVGIGFYEIIVDPSFKWYFLTYIVIPSGSLFAIFTLPALVVGYKRRHFGGEPSIPEQILRERLKAFKTKYCPIVELVDE